MALFTPTPGEFAIVNASVITPTGMVGRGTVEIENGIIRCIKNGAAAGRMPRIDASGAFLLPGFVDIHGDSLEQAIAPRPAAPFPLDVVLPVYDATLALHGITTMYHCVGLAELGEMTKPLRSREKALEIIHALNRFKPQSKIRTRIHLRYEILDTASLPTVVDLVDRRSVDLISLMDHTPGFGVFQDIDAYRRYHLRSGGSLPEADALIEHRLRLRETVDEQAIVALIRLCREKQIPVASHDDHTREKIRWACRHNIAIAEFPVTREAVNAAREHHLFTVFGAANMVRGGSHAENLSASDMVAEKLADILCSDYSPMSLLSALFQSTAVCRRSLPEMVPLMSSNPARAAGLHHTGSIEEGKDADLILVRTNDTGPKMVLSVVCGNIVYACPDRE